MNKVLILSKISIFILLSGLNNVTYANNADSKNQTQRILSVNGSGKESIPANLSNVNLSIEVNANTANIAQKEVAKRATIVVNYLKQQNVDKLKTTNVNLSPRYEYENNKQPKLIGYTASNSISFQVNQEKAGSILDEAIKQGATRIDGISFSADSISIQKAKNIAIAHAVKDAEQKAIAALSILNFSIKDIIGINIDNSETISIPQPRVMMAQHSMEKLGAPMADATPIIGGNEEINANITLSIAY